MFINNHLRSCLVKQSVHLFQMGAELGALAISHLEEVTDAGIAAMAKAKTAAVLLPTTAYILRYCNTHTHFNREFSSNTFIDV